ncbi:MAG: TIGR00341 family protein [Isosphaerales bacterium]
MSTISIEPPDEHYTSREAVRKNIQDNAVFSRAFLTMNVLAAVVACYGLLEDSAAVVIGAMVIATLLGPITGIALALVVGDNGLLRKALLAEATGVVLVLGMALVIGVIHRDAPLTREILSRTRPTLLDLIIDLAGGAAGAYASASPRLSTGLVGVAIATALVPPLSACGICLGRGDASLGFGAFLLFITNLVAIQFASSVVLWLFGFHKLTPRLGLGRSVILRNASSFGILSILGLMLGLHAVQTLTNHLFEAETRAKLIQALKAYPSAELIDLRFQQATDKVVVTAEIKSQRPLGPDEVAALEDRLVEPTGAKLELVVHTILTRQATRKGYLHEPSEPGVRAPTGADR